MGSVGGLLGLNGGAGGTGFASPQLANIKDPTTQAQLDAANAGVQGGLGAQNSLLQAIQAQNGLQNQSNVYNQLSNVASGQGPNPAQAMLNQETAKNVANQAALMAGQRGSNANAGLIARQASMQGGNLQQQAVGQGATMQAQQSLNALGQMGGIAGQQVGNQIGQTNANTAAQQATQNALLNARSNFNSAQVGNQGNVNQANAGLAGNVMGMQGQVFGGAANGAAAALTGGASTMAEGGEVEAPSAYPGQSKFGQFLADNARVDTPTPSGQIQQQDFSKMGDQVSKGVQGAFSSKPMVTDLSRANEINSGPAMQMSASNEMSPFMAAQGGKVPAMVSPGERYLKPSDVKKVEKGANPMEVGEKIPGKPKVGGAKNSYANDTVPKTLDEGGIVLPRSVTMAKHPHWAAHAFVKNIMAQKGKK